MAFVSAVKQAMEQSGLLRTPSSTSLMEESDSVASFAHSGVGTEDATPSILRIGDIISLYVEDRDAMNVGFLSVDGMIDTRLGVAQEKYGSVPANFRECLFVVHNVNQYSAAKQYLKDKEELELKEAEASKRRPTNDRPSASNTAQRELLETDGLLSTQRLRQLANKAEQEKKNNQIEAERAIGREVSYGQAIQLLHLKSKKFLTVARESAELQKDCMRLTLDEHGNTASYFNIVSYFRFKKEGEKVRVGDQIRLWSKKFNQYLHFSSKFTYVDDPQEKKEANMTTSMENTKWRIVLYSSYLCQKEFKTALKAGDVVRIYHRELEGYLTVVEDKKKTQFDLLQTLLGNKRYKRLNESAASATQMKKTEKEEQDAKVKIFASQNAEEMKSMISNIWEIEKKDRAKGGLVNWNGEFRFRNVTSGRYLAIVPASGDISSDDDDDEDDEDIVEELESTDDEQPTESKQSANAESSSSLGNLSVPAGGRARRASLRSLAKTASISLRMRSGSNAASTPPDTSKAGSASSSSTPANDGKAAWDVIKNRVRRDSQAKQNTVPGLQLGQLPKINTEKIGSIGERFDIIITDSAGPETLFAVLSPSGMQGEVQYDSFIRLFHKQTGCWLHSSKQMQKAKSALFRQQSVFNFYDTMQFIDIDASPQFYEEDVYSVSIVSKEDVDNVIYVQSVLPLIQTFIIKVSQGHPLRTSDCTAMIKAFSELILFCTKSNETDPMKREGIPYANRQRILRETKIIDITMAALRLPFEKRYIRLEKINTVEYKQYYKLFRLGYRLVKQMCKSNNDNGLYVSRYIETIQGHLNHALGAEEALLEILTNNVELLNRISFNQIKYFVDMLGDNSLNAKYLQFLSALCSIGDIPVVKNQDAIVTLLFSNNYSPQMTGRLACPYLVIPFMEQGTLYISLDETQKVPLAEVVSDPMHNSLLEYCISSIYLCSRLCMGRNAKSVPIISSLLTYELVLHCIKNEDLPARLRSSFCSLILTAYVDVNPFARKPLLVITRKWTELEVTEQNKGAAAFKDLKAYLKKYFTKNASLDVANVEGNKLLLVLVQLCRNMFEFSIFRDLKDISKIITPLYQILDGQTDVLNKKKMTTTVRYRESEANLVVTQIKLEILKIFSIVLDIRTNRRLTKFLLFYKHQYGNWKSNNFISAFVTEEHEDKFIKDIFSDFQFENKFAFLDELLMDLTRYENVDLSTSALQLLFRANSQKEELAEVLPRIELLVSEPMAKSYDNLNSWYTKLMAVLKSSKLEEEEAEHCLAYISEIVADIKKNGQRSQRLCRNLGIHTQSILTLQQLQPGPSQDHPHRLIYKHIVMFLEEFVRGNTDNQKLLFPHIEFFMSSISNHNVDTTSLLVQIFRNNRALCSVLEEKHIRYWIDIIADCGLYARFLDFLRAVVVVDGKPIMRNQTLVTKALLERQRDVVLLFNDEEGIKERNKLIRKRDHIINPNGRLNYHIKLLNLLCDCADGKNNVTEVKLQSLLSMDQIIDILLNPQTINILRDPLMKFLDEVYINTEKQSSKVAESEKLWVLFMKFNQELAIYVDDDLTSIMRKSSRRSSILRGLRSDTLAASHGSIISEAMISGLTPGADRRGSITLTKPLVSSSSGRGGTQPVVTMSLREIEALELDNIEDNIIDNVYTFKLMVPFLHHYFKWHFLNDSTSNEKKEIIAEISKRLVLAYRATANPVQRRAVRYCLETIGSQSQVPEDTKQLIEVFMKASKEEAVLVHQAVSKASLYDGDEEICKHYSGYAKTITATLEQLSDFSKVANEYLTATAGQTIRRTLINILASLNNSGYTPATLTISLQALQMLHIIAQSPGMQESLADSGAMELVLQLIASDQNEIVSQALKLGILLLEGGNKAVQQNLYDIFRKGSSDPFFLALQSRINMAANEIKDRRNFFKQQLEKQLALQELAKTRKVMENNNRELVAQANSQDEDFVERGHILKIMRFLQLMCEGHNDKLQNYLRNQEFTRTVSVNLVQECLNYTLQLHRYIDRSNIEIAVQCFDTLTELVQGPCIQNQQQLGNSKLIFMANEVLSNQYDDRLRNLDSLNIKFKVVLTLISLIEGPNVNTQQTAELIRSSLNVQNIARNMEYCHKLLGMKPSQLNDELVDRLNQEINEPTLYPDPVEVQSMLKPQTTAAVIEKMKRRIRRVGIHYYFLINMLMDSEKLLPHNQRHITNMLHEKQTEMQLQQLVSSTGRKSKRKAATADSFHIFKNETGRIEIVRDNQMERIYFQIPHLCTHLSARTKESFEKNAPRNSSQEKIQNLFNQTTKCRIEMEHYAERSNSSGIVTRTMWPWIESQWNTAKFFGFLFSIVMNFVLCLTYKKTYDTFSHGSIPVPGSNDPLDNPHNYELTGRYAYNEIYIVMNVLGIIQLVITVALFLTYLHFYTMLKVKLQFTEIDKNKSWEDVKKQMSKLKFIGKFLWRLKNDSYFWFIFVYLIVSVLGYVISPLIYCIHLFEVIVRFSTLTNVSRAITLKFSNLSVTALLMTVCLYFFSQIIFAWFWNMYLVEIDGDNKILCDTTLRCFASIANYGLRSDGFWEDVMPVRASAAKFFVDLGFYFTCVVLLINIVFGTILDSFATLRQQKEEHEALKKNKCYICDIEKSRFDLKANEGLSFERHTKEDHYMWNYVYFLVYLYQKSKTEYTGSEQYVADLVAKDDLSFFPILRSLVLEEADEREGQASTKKIVTLHPQEMESHPPSGSEEGAATQKAETKVVAAHEDNPFGL